MYLDRGGEVAGDDGVEEDEDQQRHPEEEADDREEEGLDPGRVHVRVALRVVGVRVLGQGWYDSLLDQWCLAILSSMWNDIAHFLPTW